MSNSDNPPQSGNAVPKAEVRAPKRFYIIWLVPLITILVAGWLGYRALSERGPTIRITFETADGLQAGKTSIMFKGVQTGTVKSITISKDLSQAVVEAEMTKETDGHLTEGTQFWVVRPKVGLTGISGLSTLVSGAYIAMSPGPGKATRSFKGLSEAPLSDAKGTTFALHADRLGSIHDAAPVLYRDVTVGEVVNHNLGKGGEGVDVEIVVYPAYADLVRKNSIFWNSSGIDVEIGNIFDASVRIDSIASLVAGGIAFATPPGASEAAPSGSSFDLHDRRPVSLDLGDDHGLVLVLTAKSPNGVAIGDQVTYRQIPVGKVLDIRLAEGDKSVEITVHITKRHAGLVHEKSVFWNASGIDLDFGNLLHPNIRIGSIESLVAGGIAFYNPPDPGAEARYGQRFALMSEAPSGIGADGEATAKPFEIVLTAAQSKGVDVGAPVLYHGIEIGSVKSLELNAAENGVEISLAIAPDRAGLIHDGSVFWNVSGIQVEAGDLVDAKIDVQSLKTLIRGGIALANPAASGPPAAAGARFALRDARPAQLLDKAKVTDALQIVLKAEVEGSVKQGDPVLYREVQVGEVSDIELSDEADVVLIHVDIQPRYAVLVQTNSVFWNASGIHASFGLFSGAQIDVESLSALLRGGIAFATPPDGGKAAGRGAAFPLYSEPKKEWKSWAPHIRLPQAPVAADEGGAPAAAATPAAEEPQAQSEEAGSETEAAEPAAPAATAEESKAADEDQAAGTAPIPDSVTLPGGGRVSSYVLTEALAGLGFDNIGNVQHVGNIAHVEASWQGENVKLRVDTENGQITTGE